MFGNLVLDGLLERNQNLVSIDLKVNVLLGLTFIVRVLALTCTSLPR